MKRLKYLLFLILMLLLWLPMVQQLTGYFTEPLLKGAFTVPSKPVFSMDSLKIFRYQKQTEDYLNYSFGFRGLFVKIKNSLEYIFWKEIPVEDNVEGKDGYIFSKGSILGSIGVYYNGIEKNKTKIEKINFLKESLEKHGSHLLVMMAPSKECVLTGNLPYIYHNQFKNHTNYKDLVEGYKKYNIPFIDFCSYFRKINDTSRFPLYTKTGFHWSAYGASVAHDSLIHFISRYFDKPMPTYIREGVEWSDTARWSDNDFEDPQNFFFKLDHSRYVYPKLKILESSKKNFRPKVVIIGDSFFWQLKDQKMMKDIFSEDSKFWYYFATTSFPIGDVAGVPLKEINIIQELQTADLVILVGSMGTLADFPFGVTDYYYENFEKPEMVKGIFDGIKEYIKGMPKWIEKLSKAALLNSKPVDEIIDSEAKRILSDKISFNFKAKNGKYVCADAANNNIVIADKEQASAWELFSYFQLDENNIVLTSFRDKILSAELSGKGEITATRNKIGAWEIFEKLDLGNNLVAFKATNGKYLRVDEKTKQIFADGNSIGENEKFKMINK